MEQSPSWEANSFSASQEIPRILWNPMFHYSIQKNAPAVRILSQINPVHTTSLYFLNTHFNIILPSTPRTFRLLFSSGLTTKTLSASFLFPICATCPTHFILLDFITRLCSENYGSLISSCCSLFHAPCHLVLHGPKYLLQHLVLQHPQPPNILLSTLFSNTLSLQISSSSPCSPTPSASKYPPSALWPGSLHKNLKSEADTNCCTDRKYQAFHVPEAE